MDEFALVRKYFTSQPVARRDVVTGIGDDAAVLEIPPGMQLVVTTDTLIAGTHFPMDTDAYSIGYKALAVNLSDLAAMGAEAAWALLNLSLPKIEKTWLAEFSRGLFALAQEYQVQLIGGDTVRGPLGVSLQLHGWVPHGQALRRRGARPGDGIYITGALGDAGLGLMCVQGRFDLPPGEASRMVEKLNRPMPRVREGMALRGLASAAIDVSDGLVADLGHVLNASGVGARVQLDALPISDVYAARFREVGGWEIALANGDDYELCFTVPADRQMELERVASGFACGLTSVGRIETDPGLRLIDEHGQTYTPERSGFAHFDK